MKARCGHILLDGKYQYKDLARIAEPLFYAFFSATKIQPVEDVCSVVLEMNVRDLEKNQKPEGWNRESSYPRLYFPLTHYPRVEIVVEYKGPATEAMVVTEKLSGFLSRRGFNEHAVSWDRLPLTDLDRTRYEDYKKQIMNWKRACDEGAENCQYRKHDVSDRAMVIFKNYPDAGAVFNRCIRGRMDMCQSRMEIRKELIELVNECEEG